MHEVHRFFRVTNAAIAKISNLFQSIVQPDFRKAFSFQPTLVEISAIHNDPIQRNYLA